MNRIIIFAIVISASLLLSCKDNRTYKNKLNVHYENLESQVLEIKSYNSALFELDTANFDEELKSIQNEYSLFIGDNLDNPAAITYIRNFVTDTFCIRINEMVEQKFKDKSSLNKDIRSVYQRFRYYYPEIELPQPYFYISGIDYETPTVIVAPEGVAISLDYYLTNDDKIYDYVGMPRFRSLRCQPLYITRDLAMSLYGTFVEKAHRQKDVLSEMIYLGKKYYFVEAMNPNLPDSVLLGYSSKQMQWAYDHEGDVWASIVGNDMLYAKGLDVFRNLFGDGPFTQAFSNDAPARLGEFIGLQIVRSFMTNNEMSLQDLMLNDDVQQIFQSSMYKPLKQ